MDRLETREFAYFVSVAEELHFGRAAERLGMAEPPLSRAISRLERRIGVRLLDRTSRRVTLTTAGQAFLDASRDVLVSMDTAVRRAQHAERSNRLVVANRPAQGAGLLAEVMHGYDRLEHALPVEILFTTQQAAALRDGTADVALMCGTEDLTGLRTAELIREAPFVLLPAGHRLASRATAVTIGELRQLDTFTERCPDISLDAMADLVALERLAVLASESTVTRLGPGVAAVPVADMPATLLTLAWTSAAPSPAITAFISEATRIAKSRIHQAKAS